MSETAFPEVRLAAVVITRGKLAKGAKFLTVFNPKWGAFTLPMSKQRVLSDPNVSTHVQKEKSLSTAIRAVAEVLGRPLGPDELPKPLGLESLGPYNQSPRDGVWKAYHFEVFHLELATGHEPATSTGAVAWLTLEEMETHQPISPTALMIVQSTQGESILQGKI